MRFILSLIIKSGEKTALGVDEQFARLLGIPDDGDELSQVSRRAKIDLTPLRAVREEAQRPGADRGGEDPRRGVERDTAARRGAAPDRF